MRRKIPTFAELRTMFAETDLRLQNAARIVEETSLQMKETDRIVKETSRTVKDLSKQLGGMGLTNGEFAEDLFYSSLKKTMTFAGIHFDQISDKFARNKIMPDKTEKQAQFDIVLLNGDSIALIEVKYKVRLEDVEEMIEKKIPNFRYLYPEYEGYKLYLGIGSFVFKDRITQEAQKLGIGLMQQSGDDVEYQTQWVRAY